MMINDSFFGNPTKLGTAGGLLTVLLVNIQSGDIVKTIVLTAIGGTVSFFISLAWKNIIKRWKR